MHYLKEAIKLVSIGKKGNRSLSQDLVKNLLNTFQKSEIDDLVIDPIQKTVLAVALYFKGPNEHEQLLLKYLLSGREIKPDSFINQFIPHTKLSVQSNLLKILRGDIFSRKESEKLGDFLFNITKYSTEEDDMARAMSATWLRLRYASNGEYSGLHSSFMKTLQAPFSQKMVTNKNLIQLSEPFNGVEKSPLITPLIALSLRDQGFYVLSLCGDSSGPKYGVTLKNIGEKLNAPFINSNQKPVLHESQWGTYLDHKALSGSWEHWRNLRKRMIKRPFMATLEKFTRVMGAGISITSAFHEPFLEKMLSLGEFAGFPINIVIRKGREGSLTFSLSKPVVIHCSVKKKSGDFERHSFEYSMHDLGEDFMSDGRETVNLDKNIHLIQNYLSLSKNNERKQKILKSEDYTRFFWQTKLTISGLNKALSWAKSLAV